jgi:hypothetical protein
MKPQPARARRMDFKDFDVAKQASALLTMPQMFPECPLNVP